MWAPLPWDFKDSLQWSLLESKGDILPRTIGQGSESIPGTSRTWLFSLILLSRQPWLAPWLCSYSPSCFLVFPTFQDNTWEVVGLTGPVVDVQRQCWPELKKLPESSGPQTERIIFPKHYESRSCLSRSQLRATYSLPRCLEQRWCSVNVEWRN